jgi:hypothetical protein
MSPITKHDAHRFKAGIRNEQCLSPVADNAIQYLEFHPGHIEAYSPDSKKLQAEEPGFQNYSFKRSQINALIIKDLPVDQTVTQSMTHKYIISNIPVNQHCFAPHFITPVPGTIQNPWVRYQTSKNVCVTSQSMLRTTSRLAFDMKSAFPMPIYEQHQVCTPGAAVAILLLHLA